MVVKSFKSTFYSTYNVKTKSSSLEYFFYCGLLALKTSFCFKNHYSIYSLTVSNPFEKGAKSKDKNSITIFKKNNYSSNSGNSSNICPICNKEIGDLAKKLPLSQHDVTSLLCRKTKKVMDHSDPPLATSQGYLYSTSYINNQLKKNSDSIFYCNEESKHYKLNEFKKVFIV